MPFSLKIMQVGKIVVTGLAAMGAVVLGEGIEAGLLAIPVVGQILAIEIPLIGSIASLLGVFLGAVISGIVGAIVINWLQKKIESKLKGLNLEQQVEAVNYREFTIIYIIRNRLLSGIQAVAISRRFA